VRTILRKSLLYRSGTGVGYCINHVEGCSHGCRYPCYAMLIKKRAGAVSGYDDWRDPKLVVNALELLEKELRRLKGKIESVHLCFSTDPFMVGFEEVHDLTVAIAKRLHVDGIPCTFLTKGLYPIHRIEDLDSRNSYGITVVSLSESFRRRFEPYAAPIVDRLATLREIHKRGFKTWACIEPYPTPNLVKQDLREILDRVSFVDEIVFGKLNYNRVINDYPFPEEFYRQETERVAAFCSRKGIACYLK
jgi:DNA repair photolyase